MEYQYFTKVETLFSGIYLPFRDLSFRVSGNPTHTQARDGFNILSVTLAPRDLPDGDMLAYKNLPAVSVVMEGGASVSCSLTAYDNAMRTLTLGFEVPESAAGFGLHWADLVEIPLDVNQ